MSRSVQHGVRAETIVFLARVEDSLGAALSSEEERLAFGELAELQALVEPLRRLVLSAGKRVRPTFCYWGWRGSACDGETSADDVVKVATAMELVHTCAIVHDDLMDSSDWRRGQPSLHRTLAGWSEGQILGCGAAEFGRSAALLAGHLCLVWADRLLDELPPAVSSRVRSLCRELRTEMTGGQYLDLLPSVGGAEPTVDSCLRLAGLKTGRYTIERPLQLGALVGRASPHLLSVYRRYGRPLGVAFQLADDLADVFENTTTEGKGIGEDLRGGKATIPVILARRSADLDQLAVLDGMVGQAELSAVDLAAVRELFFDTGAVQAVTDLIASHVAAAKAAVTEADLPPGATAALLDLADTVGRSGIAGPAAPAHGSGAFGLTPGRGGGIAG